TGNASGTQIGRASNVFSGSAAYDLGLSVAAGQDIWFGDGSTANMVIKESGNVGISTSTPSAKLHVAGTVLATSDSGKIGLAAHYQGADGRRYELLSCFDCGSAGLGGFEVYDSTAGAGRAYIAAGVNGWQTPSDLRLKDKIETLNVLERIDGLRGTSYELRDSGKRQIGVIAQEVALVFPEAVSGEESEGRFLGVSYDAIAAIALQGVKELYDGMKEIRETILSFAERIVSRE